MKNIICLVLHLLVSMTLMAEQSLLDRLIVEISGKSYSQKQLETYQLLRTIAMGEDAKIGLPAAASWADQVESFKNEMLVYTLLENDQQKLNSFPPDQKKLKEAESRLAKNQARDPELDTFIRQRQVTDAEISRIFMIVFRVEAYSRSRLQLSAVKTNEEIAFNKLDTKADWFQALLKQTAYRFYSGAKEYQPLATYRN